MIEELEGPSPRGKSQLAKVYNVSEGAVRKTCTNREAIKRRSADFSENVKNKKLRVRQAKFPELESKLIEWIETEEKLPITASIVMGKAAEMATQMTVEDFKASNMWYQQFKKRNGLEITKPGGEANKIVKSEPLLQLDDLYNVFQVNDVDLMTDTNTEKVQFLGYRKLFENVAGIKEQLNCVAAMESAPDVYDELKMTHDHFLYLLKKANAEEKLVLPKTS